MIGFGWLLDGFWMGFGLVLDGYWMGFGWLLDGFWMGFDGDSTFIPVRDYIETTVIYLIRCMDVVVQIIECCMIDE